MWVWAAGREGCKAVWGGRPDRVGAPLQRKQKNGSEDPPLQIRLCPYNNAASKMFAKRTNWNFAPNRLSEALAAHRAAGKPMLDLTLLNHRECEIEYHR